MPQKVVFLQWALGEDSVVSIWVLECNSWGERSAVYVAVQALLLPKTVRTSAQLRACEERTSCSSVAVCGPLDVEVKLAQMPAFDHVAVVWLCWLVAFDLGGACRL